MSQTKSIEKISSTFRDDPNVRALFLSGSFGCGLEDEYSDIDFLLVTRDGANDETAALCKEAIGNYGNIVLWWDRSVKPMLINAITEDWLRVDVEMATPEQVAGRNRKGLKVVFDRDRIVDTLSDEVPPPGLNPARLKGQAEEFIRIVGLLPLALGRKEFQIGMTGAFLLRGMLIDLLIEETAAPNRGGMLHLNRQISEDQKALLASMPPLEPTEGAIRKSYIAYAAAFLPLARAMAKRTGVDWPERFEAATWANLSAKLGISKPYEL